MDKYFVEMEVYKKVKKVFYINGIVIFIGLFGCGKIMVVVYLIRENLYKSIFRNICLWEELLYIDKDEKVIVFIDNIFL